jgi:hypothetical protein
MSFQLHERGIHALCFGAAGARATAVRLRPDAAPDAAPDASLKAAHAPPDGQATPWSERATNPAGIAL